MKKENATVFDGGKNITNLIYEFRGKQVMLDSDLAKLYQVKTKRINEAVYRNGEKFPERFSWVLDDEELAYLRSQIATANDGLWVQPEPTNANLRSQPGAAEKYEETPRPNSLAVNISNMSRSNPRVFTEQGVYMLATILRSSIATEVSIAIMDAFVAMRHYMPSNLVEQKYINNLVFEHDERLRLVEQALSNFGERNNHLFFDGQIYDAYSLLKDIFARSKKEIIIVDNYIDKQLLDVVSRIGKAVTVVTDKYNNTDYEKYKKQYHNVKLEIKNKIHDRFIIVDRETLFHCGASFKDLGRKCFAINKIDDQDYLERLIEYLELSDS